jgi:4-amino-4-deoxy-L-arabinose transferase-like glycosyltransferase
MLRKAESRLAPGRPAWWEPAGVVVILAAFGLAHLVLRVGLSPVLTVDDSRELMFAQTLEWGYQSRQPPLYNWLVWAAVRLFGPGVLALTVVKYAVLAVAYGVVYAAGRGCLADRRLPALAAFSMVLMVPIGWVVHEALTHSIAVLAAAAATFYALLRVEATGRPAAYVALGAAVAAGLLSKFSYALFAGALVLAALSLERFRARLLHPRLGFALVTAVAVALPFFVWFYGNRYSIGRIYAEEVDPGDPEPYFRGMVAALYYAVRVSAYYLTPVWIVLLALFPRAWRASDAVRPPSPAERLLARFFLAEMAIVLVGTLIGQLTYLKFRWLMPAFFLFPLYVCCRVDRRPLDDRRLGWLARGLLATALLVMVAFVASIYRGDWLGRPSHLTTPYDALAARLTGAGFTGGTIAGGDGPIAGNLRLAFPRARVVRLPNPDYLPPPSGGGQCLIVWEKERGDGVPDEIRQWLATALDVRLPAGTPVEVAELPYHFSRRSVLRVRYVLVREGAGRCG